MTDKEIVEYYYKHIKPDEEYHESDGEFYYKGEIDGKIMYFQHSGSDIHLAMKPEVLKHMKDNE